MDSSATAQGPLEEETFLDWLEDQELADLRSLAITRKFPRGQTLFHQGEVPGKVVILTTGRVKVSADTEEGREVVLSFKGPGELLGEVSALDGRPRSGTVTALEPVEALVLPLGDFHSFLERHPRISLAMLRVVCGRLRDADRQRVEFAAYDTVGRVARRLLELSEKFGQPGEDGVEITLPLSQEELGNWAASSREAVTKALHLMRELGWVETHRRRITVRDSEALRRLSS
jgi:CRP/FNR family transcriptional regulator, cyclic AMP receptor protein